MLRRKIMKISKIDQEYFLEKKFADEYNLKIEGRFLPNERIKKILKLTKNKKVIHLGCCDHIPLIKTRIENKKWLHGLLTENCKKVLGIDINAEAVQYVKDLRYSNLENYNICLKGNNNIENEKWDYIIMGENKQSGRIKLVYKVDKK